MDAAFLLEIISISIYSNPHEQELENASGRYAVDRSIGKFTEYNNIVSLLIDKRPFVYLWSSKSLEVG